MSLPEFSIVIPVYNEADNIGPLLREIESSVRGDWDVLIVYDFDEDTTIAAVESLDPPLERVRLVKNEYGRGVVGALRTGLRVSDAWLGVVVTMADRSDPPECINGLVGKLREGYDVVAGSRYMKGGRQIGGPLLKSSLSRLSGVLAWWLTGIGIHDVTTNFRAYSRRVAQTLEIESKGGFEVGLEVTVKCHLRGWRVAEVPATWYDRSVGQSRFRLFGWMPGYLRWYLILCAGDPFGLSRRIRQARFHAPQQADYQFFGVYEQPGYGWIVQRHRNGIIILALTKDDRLVLARIHRPYHETGEADWELPGGAHDEGETMIETAHRELREETGYATDDPGELLPGKYEVIPGMGSFTHRVVVLRGCARNGPPTCDPMEGIREVAEFGLEEVDTLVRTSKITAAPSLVGLAVYRWGID